MDTDALAPQPHVRAPRPRLTWIWPVITFGLIMSACGFWISTFMAISHEPHLQIIGSGWPVAPRANLWRAHPWYRCFWHCCRLARTIHAHPRLHLLRARRCCELAVLVSG